MTFRREDEYLTSLVQELCKLSRETEWIEFKENVQDPEEIGEYVSALANSAAMVGKASAYMVWGISDREHEIVGTNFKPRSKKVGNEELENWLLRLLEPRIEIRFFETVVEGCSVSKPGTAPSFSTDCGSCSGTRDRTRRPDRSPKADAIRALVGKRGGRDRYLMKSRQRQRAHA